MCFAENAIKSCVHCEQFFETSQLNIDGNISGFVSSGEIDVLSSYLNQCQNWYLLTLLLCAFHERSPSQGQLSKHWQRQYPWCKLFWQTTHPCWGKRLPRKLVWMPATPPPVVSHRRRVGQLNLWGQTANQNKGIRYSFVPHNKCCCSWLITLHHKWDSWWIFFFCLLVWSQRWNKLLWK